MNTTVAIAILALGISFLVLLLAIFRPPDAPKPNKLILFLVWVAVSAILGYMILVYVFRYNPSRGRVLLARMLTGDRIIYLGDIVPGLADLNYIHRVDTDLADEPQKEEWLVFYRYDSPGGPFGAAIYDPDNCRPPAIQAFELVPVAYDYLGESGAEFLGVANMIAYQDPKSRGRDWPEVVIAGSGSGGYRSDLNIFRKVGVEPSCTERLRWQREHPGQPLPDEWRLRYENIGSFRSTGWVEINLENGVVTVWDRAGFERSQFAVRRVYTPQQGSYFKPGTQTLLDPVEQELSFGTGRPAEVSQVYYPEKSVLAFYLDIVADPNRARPYLCSYRQDADKSINPAEFGLTVPLKELQKVIVCEIRYEPDAAKEQNHETRTVWARILEVKPGGSTDCNRAHLVRCTVEGVDNAQALPYGCEWCLRECRAP